MIRSSTLRGVNLRQVDVASPTGGPLTPVGRAALAAVAVALVILLPGCLCGGPTRYSMSFDVVATREPNAHNLTAEDLARLPADFLAGMKAGHVSYEEATMHPILTLLGFGEPPGRMHDQVVYQNVTYQYLVSHADVGC